MSRNLLRTSPWSTTDHICLGCRRRLLQQASHSLDVRRQRASTSAQASNSKPHGRPSTEAKSASKTAKLLIRKFKGPSVSAAAQAGKHKTKDLSAAQETDLVNATQGRSITQALLKYGKTGRQEQASVSASPAPWDVQHDWAEKPGKSGQQSSSARSRNATGTKLDHGAPSFDQVSKKLPVFEVNVGELTVDPLDIEQPPVPPLAHGLDRVLFNPNIYLLQDPHSGVYNFDPYIEDIMPVNEFDFAALPPYKTSSEDSALTRLAAEHNARYVGSTSSMTGALCHFHFLLSHFRHLNFNMLSQEFKPESKQVTRIYRAPYSIFLRWKNGSYAIDADKEHDSPNVLMMLGKSLEKLLTLEKDDMERYRKSSPGEVTQEEREAVDAFQYTTMGNMLMRSQLDAYDPRLPGYGTFDLKTRAVLPIRHNAREFEDMLGYELKTLRGQFESYEREYYDMARATMLKYMLQARMGKMDGIFVAYHNVERIFGFQYLPMSELDRVVHGTTDPTLGDGEFKLSLKMFNHLLDMATEKFPEQSLRVVFEATGKEATPDVLMRVYAEPLTESEIHEIQSAKKKVFTAYEDRMQNGMSQKEALQQIIAEQAKELAEDEADDKSVSTEGEQIDGIEDGTAVEAQDVVADAASPAPAASSTASSTSDVTAGAPSHEDRVTKQSAAGDGSEKDAADILVAATQQAKTTQKAKAAKDAPLKPLFAVSVLVEHTVNNYTGHKRPDGLTAEDTWKVKYAIRDHAEKNLAGAWTLYRTTKQARKSAFMNIGEEDNPFYRELHRMVSSGREYREALDKAQEGTTPIIWSPSMPKSVQKQEQAT